MKIAGREFEISTAAGIVLISLAAPFACSYHPDEPESETPATGGEIATEAGPDGEAATEAGPDGNPNDGASDAPNDGATAGGPDVRNDTPDDISIADGSDATNGIDALGDVSTADHSEAAIGADAPEDSGANDESDATSRDDRDEDGAADGPATRCLTYTLPLQARVPASNPARADAICGLTCGGGGDAPAMSYCKRCAEDAGLSDASAEDPWVVCRFAEHQALPEIDLDLDGDLEVRFCIESGEVTDSLGLWYGTGTSRRRLELKRSDEILAPGCYTRLFSAADACASDQKSCGERCAPNDATCLFKPGVLDQLELAAEYNCQGDTSAVVTLESITYLSAGCRCTSSGRCTSPDRPFCLVRPDALLPDPALCGTGRCAGICVPSDAGCRPDPDWVGRSCVVQLVPTGVCVGHLACIGGNAFCAANDCISDGGARE